MMQAQATSRTWHKVLCCPNLTLNHKTEELAKAVKQSVMWGAPAWHPTRNWQEQLTSWRARMVGGHRKTDKSQRNNSSRMWRERRKKKDTW